MTKQEQIEAKRIKPIEIGDYVKIVIGYNKTVTTTEGKGKKKIEVTNIESHTFSKSGYVHNMDVENIHVTLNSVSVPSETYKIVKEYYPEKYERVVIVPREYVHPTFDECGGNPFCKEKRRINFYNQDIETILSKAGYRRGKMHLDFDSDDWGFRINFDPYVTDKDGVKQHYQRGLVWTLEQKQLLIESIYQGIEIGKFLFRHNSTKRLNETKAETGVGYGFDCVDGKQRFFAILDFIEGKYPDQHGNYWSDLSIYSQRRFMSYPNLSYGEMDETATDEDVLDNFLTLNHTGVPMSKEHIEYVRSFNLK